SCHTLIPSFPTRRSSDLFHLRSPVCWINPTLKRDFHGPRSIRATFQPGSIPSHHFPCQTCWIRQRQSSEVTSRCRSQISAGLTRSEEHTSELQSHLNLVC